MHYIAISHKFIAMDRFICTSCGVALYFFLFYDSRCTMNDTIYDDDILWQLRRKKLKSWYKQSYRRKTPTYPLFWHNLWLKKYNGLYVGIVFVIEEDSAVYNYRINCRKLMNYLFLRWWYISLWLITTLISCNQNNSVVLLRLFWMINRYK